MARYFLSYMYKKVHYFNVGRLCYVRKITRCKRRKSLKQKSTLTVSAMSDSEASISGIFYHLQNLKKFLKEDMIVSNMPQSVIISLKLKKTTFLCTTHWQYPQLSFVSTQPESVPDLQFNHLWPS